MRMYQWCSMHVDKHVHLENWQMVGVHRQFDFMQWVSPFAIFFRCIQCFSMLHVKQFVLH